MSTQLAQTTILPPTFPANNKPIGPNYGSVFEILDLSYMEDQRHSRAITRGVVEGERMGTEFPHFSLSPKILRGKNERSITFLHLLKVACVGRSHTSEFSTTTLGPMHYVVCL